MDDLIYRVKTYMKKLSKEKYYKQIFEIDKILLDHYDEERNRFFSGFIFGDAEDILRIKINKKKRNKKQTEEAIKMAEIVIKNQYSNPSLKYVVFRYMIWNTYYMIENEKTIVLLENIIKYKMAHHHIVTMFAL